MPDGLYLGFDFGYKRIGVAVGQALTKGASPLTTLTAKEGVPNWQELAVLIKKWRPVGLIVGLPTRIDGQAQYTTKAAKNFAQALFERFALPVYLVDERLTTVEARTQLYSKGGYRKIQQTQVDSFAACIILEQWLQGL
ncbi:MAG TPA: Holliday junction resolvase RuvX [Legionellaceae bacterium]|nr:Holliday junction resolvase RuvX [Legionellaceae bacterium]